MRIDLAYNMIKTKRLLIRPFQLDDASFIVQLVNTPSWLAFIGDRKVQSIADAEQYLINGPFKSYEENGFGLSMIVLTDDTPIGMCGLIKRAELAYIDIGFALLHEYEKKGYAFEAAQAVLLDANQRLHLYPIAAITLEENSNSIQLLEKLGMVLENKIQYGSEELLLFKQV